MFFTLFGHWRAGGGGGGTILGPKLVKNGQKTRFSETGLGPFGMLKEVYLAHFEALVMHFGSWKIQNCLENGPFWD